MVLGLLTNMASLDVQNSLAKSQTALTASFDKISSGDRINTAADDAAGLAASETMKAQIRCYVVAEQNANNAVSMSQTADGALGQMHDVLGRMRELAMQSSNGSYSSADRDNIQQEYTALQAEMDRIKQSTTFNGVDLLNANAQPQTFQVGLTSDPNNQLQVGLSEVDLTGLMNSSVSGPDTTNAQASLKAIDDAIQTVSSQRATLGATMNRLSLVTQNIQTTRLNLTAANSRIRDTDVASEMATLSKNQILSQAGVSVLAQANQLPQLSLNLLK